MKTPAAVKRYTAEFEESEADVCQYVLRQLKFYAEIEHQAATEEGWIALKLNCTPTSARSVIAWARSFDNLAK